MKDIISRFQADINRLQETLQREGNDLLERVRKVGSKSNLDRQRRELEELVERKLKKFEPAYDRFVSELKKNARKAGIDISKLEKELKRKAKTAKKAVSKAKKKTKTKTTAKKKTTRKKATTTTGKAKATSKTKARKKTAR